METTNRFRAASVAHGAQCATGPDGVSIAAVSVPHGAGADVRAGAIAARVVAAAAAHLEAGMVEVVRRPGRAPAVLGMSGEGRVRALPVALTVSHRLGRAVAAAHPAPRALGIDLERSGAVPRGLERLFLGPAERCLLERHDATTLWALKEAAWKTLGLDRSIPFHALVLECEASGALRALHHPGGACPARAALWRPWPRFVAALVWLP
jgi:4'-phosphopantetheinyl transferase EntD